METSKASFPPSIKRVEPSFVRSFAPLDGDISGRSVVVSEEIPRNEPDMWPCVLSDYLRNFRGKRVMLEYVLPNGGYAKKRGVVKAAGTNFIGLQTQGGKDLLLVDLGSVKCINIYDFNSGK